MKRLIFCFDGTWNKLEPGRATNVVLTAASIERIGRDGSPQIIHYDEGVGTGDLDQFRGGMFGTGLIDNVREAYRFLIFNYDPGDEIYVFGFSRGAYSAPTFVGFHQTCRAAAAASCRSHRRGAEALRGPTEG